MPMPRIPVSGLALLASLAAPAVAYTQMAALTANAMRALRPADCVLEYKDELGLTATEQAALRTLGLAFTDSASARQTRMMNRMQRPTRHRRYRDCSRSAPEGRRGHGRSGMPAPNTRVKPS
jgi:hypothetical protein